MEKSKNILQKKCKETVELLDKCPFCHATADNVEIQLPRPGKIHAGIQCNSCGFVMAQQYGYIYDLIAMWNGLSALKVPHAE